MVENHYSVYVLKEPDSDIVRYVGYTGKGLDHRFRRHVVDGGKTRKDNWIKSLKNKGLKPVIDLIDDGLTYTEAIQQEMAAIQLFLACGANLTNLTLGGEGIRCGTMSESVRRKIGNAHKGKIVTAEQKLHISQAHIGQVAWNKGLKGAQVAWNKGIPGSVKSMKGFKMSPESKLKMSIAKKGKPAWNKGVPSKTKGVPRSNEVKLKISLARKGKKLGPMTEEQKQKISASMKIVRRLQKQAEKS